MTDYQTAGTAQPISVSLEDWSLAFDGIVYCCLAVPPWNFVVVRPAPAGLTGFPAEDPCHASRGSLAALIHPDDRQRVLSVLGQLSAAQPHSAFEYRLLDRQGEIRWLKEEAELRTIGGSPVICGLILDITDAKCREMELIASERRYRRFFENAAEGLFRSSPAGRFVDMNPALARMLGYASAAEALTTIGDLRHLYVDPVRRREFLGLLKSEGSVAGFESEVVGKADERIWISENARAIFDGQGDIQYIEGSVVDISERKRLQETLDFRATRDDLTGLPNRAVLTERLARAMDYAGRHHVILAVAFIELDQLRVINDSMGHDAGNEFIKVMAIRLQACLRACDTVARQGREQFVVLLAEQPSREAVAETLHRIRQQVLRPWQYRERDFHVSCSIGVGVYPDDGGDCETLMKSADSAMAFARESGSNAVRFFTSEFGAQIRDRFEREQNLRSALARKDFVLHYQPRIDLRTGALTGAEVLVRGAPAGSMLMSPSQFIPLAEETGLIHALGSWILETACRQVQRWTEVGFSGLTFAINISPRQFEEGDFCGELRRMIRDTGVNPGLLELELTENLVMRDAESFISILNELKGLGIKIAIDDFGAGYSNLSYLRRFPVDRLKIDQSFIRDVARKSDDASIVRAIVTLGHSLNLCVVAEGVETPPQLRFLREVDCDEGQGDLFGAAMSQAEFESLLHIQPASADDSRSAARVNPPWLSFFSGGR